MHYAPKLCSCARFSNIRPSTWNITPATTLFRALAHSGNRDKSVRAERNWCFEPFTRPSSRIETCKPAILGRKYGIEPRSKFS